MFTCTYYITGLLYINLTLCPNLVHCHAHLWATIPSTWLYYVTLVGHEASAIQHGGVAIFELGGTLHYISPT